MKIGELIRQIADVVDAQETQAQKSIEISQAAQQAEIQTAVASSQELQAGQVAQLTQAAQNAKQAAAMSGDGTPEITALPAEGPADDELTSAPNDDETSDETMVPPLQQKHELLKKATGVENNTDTFADDDDAELARMLQIAGVGQQQPETGDVSINPKMNAAMLHFSTDNVEVD